MFDHGHPGITHVSIQSWDVKRTREWRERFGKPVVNDEPEYEGDVPLPWGNISARELVHRYWVTLSTAAMPATVRPTSTTATSSGGPRVAD